MNRIFVLYGFAVLLLPGTALWAQDSTRKKNIEITSTFKPVLREASKINFNAAPPSVDSARPGLQYQIPEQNLLLEFRPAALKPVVLAPDTSKVWEQSNFIKLGFGNVHFPYIKTGFSFGDDGRNHLNILAEHYTSKGKLKFQQNTMTSVGFAASHRNLKNMEWNAKLGFTSDEYFLYGYRPESLVYTMGELRQGFQTIAGSVNLRNTIPTDYGLSYFPSLKLSYFSGRQNAKATESNTVLDLPIKKTFGSMFAFQFSATADLTRYQHPQGVNDRVDVNNLFYVSPAVAIKADIFFLHAGLRPSWDNGVFHMLPNLMADITTNDQRFTFQLGWIGYYDKGSYQRFAGMNPWLARPDSLLNTRMQERYAGFKGSVDNHFSYSAKVGFLQYRNVPLLVNDLNDGKSFSVLYEERMQALQLHGEVEYIHGDHFSANASVNLNQYTGLKKEAKAWGMIPLEVKAGMRWQVLRDLWLRSDLWAFTSPQFRRTNGDHFKGDGGFDVSAGLEFRFHRNFNAWFQMNNILDSRYERWNQYQVFGFHMMGGVTYTFNRKK